MFKHKKIKTGGKYIEAFWIRLLSKNLILLKGSKGYLMCGYLNMLSAQRSGDIAGKFIGARTIEEALKAKLHSCTGKAGRSGLYPGQPVKDALKLIA
ncbi:MAG: DUF1805 domain-containing protein [Candidatus Omnitrophica bacterium]|nr:DUF1805 domain-containing protein [Candidatus Omnitrophota bacterium]MDD5654630.1 DUF1805 domain-containing protein [Candidatus Omnitrophota bacterium]